MIGPVRPSSMVGQIATPCYRDAVLAYRAQHPTQGLKRIAYDLRDRFPTANSATIWRHWAVQTGT